MEVGIMKFPCSQHLPKGNCLIQKCPNTKKCCVHCEQLEVCPDYCRLVDEVWRKILKNMK
jgi:hypothetical protein